MEVIKAPIPQAATAVGGFMAFLAEMGAERDTNSKRRRAGRCKLSARLGAKAG